MSSARMFGVQIKYGITPDNAAQNSRPSGVLAGSYRGKGTPVTFLTYFYAKNAYSI